MRVVGWNVMQGGGGSRAPRLVAALEAIEADVVVIGEYRPSSPLSRQLAENGWKYQSGTPDPTLGGYGAVLVVSRKPLREVEPRYVAEGCKQRWLNVEVVDSGWTIAGALVPGHHRHYPLRKKRFWDFIVTEFAPASANRPTLLIGDLNTGLHGIDEKGSTLICAEDMTALRAAGWTDVWHSLHPEERPPSTWWEPSTGNGFRLDHAFLSPSSPAAIAIEYPREIDGMPTTRAGARKAANERPPLSDHVPVIVDLR
jgi:exodeoxyribonuclease-3